uniref:Twisted gastrulation protein homolog 1-like n=1 Tax=Phallusia mammillata TaxID=59560 RepID=A0A6F9DWK9_9ASCI|nr:twisted gastrulation protein homolog 1-like [Phallusia mammillata]
MSVSHLSIIIFVLAFMCGIKETNSNGEEIHTHPEEHHTCDKATCASIVSYCLVEGSCSCNPSENCSCCADCAVCLGDLYRRCCDCVGLRKTSNYTASLPTITSTVAVLDDPLPELFQSYTDHQQPKLRYTILRFPIVEELAAHRHRHHHQRHRQNSQRGHVETVRKESRADFTSQSYWNDVQMVLRRTYDYDIRPDSPTLCSVTYFDRCLSLNQCVQSCAQMGASSYRWFHNGCCECAGSSCLNYGNMYPNCTECMQ